MAKGVELGSVLELGQIDFPIPFLGGGAGGGLKSGQGGGHNLKGWPVGHPIGVSLSLPVLFSSFCLLKCWILSHLSLIFRLFCTGEGVANDFR